MLDRAVQQTIEARIQELRWSKAQFLLDLPSLPFNRRDELPKTSVVYFTYTLDSGLPECLYIGQSRNLHGRWSGHERERDAKNYKQVRIAWIECPDDEAERLRIESRYISLVGPIWNVTGNNRHDEKLLEQEITQAAERDRRNRLNEDYRSGRRARIKLGCIGHEPEHFDPDTKSVNDCLYRLAIAALERQIPDYVVSSLNPGWSMAVAKAAGSLGIPLIAAVPMDGCVGKRSEEEKQAYRNLIVYAEKVEYSYITGNSRQMMAACDRMVLKHSGKILALWDRCQDSGAARMIELAQGQQLEVVNLWSSWTRYGRQSWR